MQQSTIGPSTSDRSELISTSSSASIYVPIKLNFYQGSIIEGRQITNPNRNPNPFNSNPSPSPVQLPTTCLTTSTSLGRQKSIIAFDSTTIDNSISAATTSEGSYITSIERDASAGSVSSPTLLDSSQLFLPVFSPVSSPDADAPVTIEIAPEQLGILDAKLAHSQFVNKYNAEFIINDVNDSSDWWTSCCCGRSFCLLLDNDGHDFVVIEQGSDTTSEEEKQSRPRWILNRLHENLTQAWIFLSSIRLCPLIGLDGERDYLDVDADLDADADYDDSVLSKRKRRKSNNNKSPTMHQNSPPRLSWSSANYNTVAPVFVVISSVVNKICDTSRWNSVSEIELTKLKRPSTPHEDDSLQFKVEDDEISDFNLSTASEFSLLSEDENGVNRYPLHHQELGNGGKYSGFQIYYTAADCGGFGGDDDDIENIKQTNNKLSQDPNYGFIYDIDSGKQLTTDDESLQNTEKKYVSVKDAEYDWLIVK